MSFHVPICCLMRWFFFVIGVPLLLTKMIPICPSCPTFVFWVCSTLLLVSHFHSLEWFSVIPGAPQPLSGLAMHHHKCFTSTHWGGLSHPWCFTAPHWCGFSLSNVFHCLCFGFISFQMFYCCSMGWFYVVPGVQLPLIGVPLCQTMCFSAIHWGSSVLSQVFHCRSLCWLCIISGVSLPII